MRDSSESSSGRAFRRSGSGDAAEASTIRRALSDRLGGAIGPGGRSAIASRGRNAVSLGSRRWIAGVAVVELLGLVGYFGLTSAEVTSLRYVLYPFVWINVGLWAVARTAPPRSSRRYRWVALGVAAGYFLILAFLAGLVGISLGHHGHDHAHVVGFQFAMASPGWGPRIAYAVPGVGHVYFVPYLVIGYLSLAYLVYAAVLDAGRTALGGAFGLASCLGCSFPLVASLATGAAGGASLATGIDALSVDLSTAAFVLAVGLLYWRPGSRT
ncbi:DUF7546 family protein [Halegenticoccus soli]|uniref:DUF7546 family protein n=1 Tax=Halegenticoccus soli TaxID=1985678 RepID=UPI00117B919B|nr:hypothetical protein [Halegenticoccus soli]